MYRRSVPILILAAALLGCSEKTDSPTGGGEEPGGPGGEPSDPNATYTLKFREAAKGEKYDVIRGRNMTAHVTVKNVNTDTIQKQEYRYEYTETILDTEDGEPRPTKVTRVYKTARKADPKGDMKDASHVGKTVTIEKYLKGYKYSVEGKSLPVQEQVEMNQDFTASNLRLEQNFPKTAVKVGDEWPIDFSAITAIGGAAQTKYDKEKSQFTGKLVKAYKKDGRQWGVIELKIKMVIDTVATNGSPIKGEANTDTTFDIVIDGSARAGSMKMKLDSTINDRDVLGNERKTTVTGTEERSSTPVK